MDPIGAILALAALIGAAGFTARAVSSMPRTPAPVRKAAGRTAAVIRHPVRSARAVSSRATRIRPKARPLWLERQRARRDAAALNPDRTPRPVYGRFAARKAPPSRQVNGTDVKPRPRQVPARPAAAPRQAVRVPAAPAAMPHLQAVPALPDTNGRTRPVTTGTSVNGTAAGLGAGADMFTSVQHLVSHVLSGGIQGKQRGALTASESLSYMADQFTTMAHRMAEPDQGYPASVWEPWLVAASHLQAASIAAGESGSVVVAIRSMTVGELAGSAVKAPHHDELNKGA